MRNIGLALLMGLFVWGLAAPAEAGHGHRARARQGYVVGYGAPAYFVPAGPVVYAPILPYITPFYSGPYFAPSEYTGPSPFVHPRRLDYSGYGW